VRAVTRRNSIVMAVVMSATWPCMEVARAFYGCAEAAAGPAARKPAARPPRGAIVRAEPAIALRAAEAVTHVERKEDGAPALVQALDEHGVQAGPQEQRRSQHVPVALAQRPAVGPQPLLAGRWPGPGAVHVTPPQSDEHR
jgi:hypothetical protein